MREEFRTSGYEVEVTSVDWETSSAATFEVAVPEAHRHAFTAKAGQFVTIIVGEAGGETRRCYSLSSCPETQGRLRFTVKRVPGGAVSNSLLDTITPGCRMTLEPPAGRFVLRPTARPLVAFAAGSGITPIHSIIRSALALTDRKVALLFANRDESSIIFRRSLSELHARHRERFVLQHHVGSNRGRVTKAGILEFYGTLPTPEVYLCGPGPFMELVESTLEPVIDPDDLVVERFGSPPQPAPVPVAITDSRSIEVLVKARLDGKTYDFLWRGSGHLLDAALESGMPAPHSCREGHCGACLAHLEKGEVTLGEVSALSKRDREKGRILPCRATPISDQIALDFDV